MATVQNDFARTEPYTREAADIRMGEAGEIRHEKWAHYYVNWTAVWAGTLATFCMMVLFGLVGIALGAHLIGPTYRVVDMKSVALWTLIFSVCSAFFASAIGGWVAAKIAGILHSEPAMLHGAIVWLLTVPLLIAAASLGAGSVFGGWYIALGPNSALSANPPFVHPDALGASATVEEIARFKTQQDEYNRNIKQRQEDSPRVTRNSALLCVTALLLGLVGSVIGGWLASGEPMNFTHYRTRKPMYHSL